MMKAEMEPSNEWYRLEAALSEAERFVRAAKRVPRIGDRMVIGGQRQNVVYAARDLVRRLEMLMASGPGWLR